MELLESNLSDGKIELLDLPPELIPRYALNLNLGEINHLCRVSQQFNQAICQNEHFWKMKFTHDYKFTPEYTGSWKKLYQNYNSLWSFGENGFGQLGLGDKQRRSSPTLIPQPVELPGSREPSSAFKAKAVSSRGSHTVLIDLEDNVWSFGLNDSGQLGLGDRRNRSTPTLIPGVRAKAVSVGGHHTVLIDLDDNVWSFGWNKSGRLGLGDEQNRSMPTLIPQFKAKAVSAGGWHTVLIDLDDNVWSFGANNFGQLGLGDQENRLSPTLILKPGSSTGSGEPSSAFKAKAVSAGGWCTTLIDLEDNVWSFGENGFGQLGLGDQQRRLTPTLIPGVKAKAVSAGEDHTVLIDLDDNVWSFGHNGSGQLGLGDKEDRSSPTLVLEPGRLTGSREHRGARLPFRAKAVSTGRNYTVLIDLEDNVWFFGWNDLGQLGLGDRRDRSTPTLIPGLKAKAVSAGQAHTVLIATLITS